MDSFSKTFGHNLVKQILQKQIGSGKVSHAYLFLGPKGLGKKTLAQDFSAQLLNTKQPQSHSDYLEFSEEYTVEAMRKFIQKLSVKPFVAKYTVAVLPEVQNLNAASSNALLKTLEEPSQTTILILTSSKAAILPTLISRCQVFTFNPFTDQELLAFCKEQKLAAPSKQLLALASGSIGRLLELLGNEEAEKSLTAKIHEFEKVLDQSLSQRLLYIDQLAVLENSELQELLEAVLLKNRTELSTHSERYSLMLSLLSALEELKGYMNKKLVLEKLLLSFGA